MDTSSACIDWAKMRAVWSPPAPGAAEQGGVNVDMAVGNHFGSFVYQSQHDQVGVFGVHLLAGADGFLHHKGLAHDRGWRSVGRFVLRVFR